MAVRTQIYLTEEQRARLAERGRRDGLAMAELIREAVDTYLASENDLEATFGAAPGIRKEIPSRAEWKDRGRTVGRHRCLLNHLEGTAHLPGGRGRLAYSVIYPVVIKFRASGIGLGRTRPARRECCATVRRHSSIP